LATNWLLLVPRVAQPTPVVDAEMPDSSTKNTLPSAVVCEARVDSAFGNAVVAAL